MKYIVYKIGKDIIFDKIVINLLKISLLTPSRITSAFLIVSTNNQVLKSKSKSKISQNNSNIIQFSKCLMLEFLNKVLKDNSINELVNHFYFLLKRSQADTNSPLSSLSSTSKSTLNTSF